MEGDPSPPRDRPQPPRPRDEQEDEERGDHRECQQRRQVGEREEAGHDPGENERARRATACGPDQERDHEHRDRQAVQVGPLRHQERQVRVVEPDVQIGLRRAVPGRVDQRPEQVVARVDPGDRRDPAEAGAEQEEDHGEGRDRAHPAEPARERVEAECHQDREDEAVERQDRERVHAQDHEGCRR